GDIQQRSQVVSRDKLGHLQYFRLFALDLGITVSFGTLVSTGLCFFPSRFRSLKSSQSLLDLILDFFRSMLGFLHAVWCLIASWSVLIATRSMMLSRPVWSSLILRRSTACSCWSTRIRSAWLIDSFTRTFFVPVSFVRGSDRSGFFLG